MRSTAALLFLSLVGCTGGSQTSPAAIPDDKPPPEALVASGDCNTATAGIREKRIADINSSIDSQIAYFRQGQASVGCGSPSGGDSVNGNNSAGGGGTTGASGAGPSQSSSTNNQTAGVDEADFVKNEGEYIYIAKDNTFRVIHAWPANTMTEVARITLEGEAKKLFIEGGRAAVFVSMSGRHRSPGRSDECTYGYDCVPTGDGNPTKIVIFDIANPNAPAKMRELSLSGSLLSARRIGSTVHTVVIEPQLGAESTYTFDGPSSADIGCENKTSVTTEQYIAGLEAVRQRELARVARGELDGVYPTLSDGETTVCSDFFRTSGGNGRYFTSLLSFDLKGASPPKAASILSDPGVVYASETSLYMAVPNGRDEQSIIHRFRIGETSALTGYAATGVVKGRVLNQFALDEHEKHLRVATTTSRAPSPTAHSTMTVLETEGKTLSPTGIVDKIAPTEDIRSVRFDGSRGYIVTFKKTDPLYVFDLGNPNAPAITGELKIPGFSTYMHMMDAQHLLTIGYDAADQGSFAYFQGVLFQIFDVSDMRNPRLVHKHVIGTRGSSSEALTNHLAFTYFAPKNLLAIPMTVCEGESGSSAYGAPTFSGLMVFNVNATTGFSERGRVDHQLSRDVSCSNWWTDASSAVKRSIFMDDIVYSISEARVKASSLANLSAPLTEVSLK